MTSTAMVQQQHHHAEHFDCGDAADICCNNNNNNNMNSRSRGRKRALRGSAAARRQPHLPPGVLDPYQVLAVRRDATASEVKHAYARLALLHHPERLKLLRRSNANSAAMQQQFAILAASYETLANSTVRKRLDDLLYNNNHHYNHPTGKPLCSQSGNSSTSAAVPRTPNKNNRKQETMIQPHSITTAAASLETNTPLAPSEPLDSNSLNHSMQQQQQQQQQEEPEEADFDDKMSHSNLQEEPQRSNVAYSPLSGGSSMVESGLASYNNDNENGETLFDCDWRECNDSLDDHDDADIKSATIMASSSIMSMVQRPPSPFDCTTCPNNDSGDGGSPHRDRNLEDPYNETASRHTATSSHHSFGRKSPSMMSSTALPALLKASSSTETTGDDVHHYSEAATERLFGGPLQLMFRARRWQPFADPFNIFQRVFKSSLGNSKSNDANTAKMTTTSAVTIPPQAISAHFHHHHGAAAATAANFTSETETMPDGRVVHRNTKLLPGNGSIVRTVTRFADPITGYTRTTIEVTSTAAPSGGGRSQKASSGTATTNEGWCGRMILCGGGCAGINTDHNEMLVLDEPTGEQQQQQQQHCKYDDAGTQATVPVDDDEWSLGLACLAWLPSCI